ncbi:MAG: helix-hairpin-helix domain-containing protein [Opitutales bacterium]|nr:helix-hairpin-helix domain-containing protein [Opitutales bacterium]
MLSTVNYLDEEALCEFPGVGPTTAKNIIKWRHQNHYFSSLDEVIQIPRIGEKKFLDITGRENLLDQFPLHDLMRTSRRFDIRFTDLSPWKNPAPGIARIILDDHETDTPHLIECARRDLHLISRKVLQWKLHFYLTNEHPEGRALYLLKKLPHLLRKVLRQRNKTKSLIS